MALLLDPDYIRWGGTDIVTALDDAVGGGNALSYIAIHRTQPSAAGSSRKVFHGESSGRLDVNVSASGTGFAFTAGPSWNYVAATGLTAETWYWVVCRFENDHASSGAISIHVYNMDGTLADSDTATVTTTAGYPAIDRSEKGEWSTAIEAGVARTFIYDVNLPDSEVQAIIAAGLLPVLTAPVVRFETQAEDTVRAFALGISATATIPGDPRTWVQTPPELASPWPRRPPLRVITGGGGSTGEQDAPATAPGSALDATPNRSAVQGAPATGTGSALDSAPDVTATQGGPAQATGSALDASANLTAPQDAPAVATCSALDAQPNATATQDAPSDATASTLDASANVGALQDAPSTATGQALDATPGVTAPQAQPALATATALDGHTDVTRTQDQPATGTSSALQASGGGGKQDAPAQATSSALDADTHTTVPQDAPATGTGQAADVIASVTAEQGDPATATGSALGATAGIRFVQDAPAEVQGTALDAAANVRPQQDGPATATCLVPPGLTHATIPTGIATATATALDIQSFQHPGNLPITADTERLQLTADGQYLTCTAE